MPIVGRCELHYHFLVGFGDSADLNTTFRKARSNIKYTWFITEQRFSCSSALEPPCTEFSCRYIFYIDRYKYQVNLVVWIVVVDEIMISTLLGEKRVGRIRTHCLYN